MLLIPACSDVIFERWSISNVVMEDYELISNLDWDPGYLSMLFESDFNDMSDLWNDSLGVSDSEILHAMDTRYCPIIEDISIDYECLYNAVEVIESQ